MVALGYNCPFISFTDRMRIEVQVMLPDYSLQQYFFDLPEGSCVSDLLSQLREAACIENDQVFVWSVYGKKVTSDYVFSAQDRFELVLPLPTSPIERRRLLALKRKNR